MCLDCKFNVQSSRHSSRLVQTDLRRMNPCCCLLIKRRSNRYGSKVSLIIRSITLQHVAVKDIGRKLFGSEVCPFFWTGVTIAYFQVSGKQPSKNEILKTWHNWLARLLAQVLRKTFGMQSYSLEVLGFSFSNTLLTVCGSKVCTQAIVSSTVIDIRSESIIYREYTSKKTYSKFQLSYWGLLW